MGINFSPTYKEKLIKLEKSTIVFEDGKPLFEPVTFEINKGQITAITGPNGIGKSQLIKKISQMAVNKNLKISCMRQIYDNNGYLKDLAEADGLDYQMFLNNLKKLGLERKSFDKKIENMSMGQQKKVELARSLTVPAELYIWDEPLNYLDIFIQEQIEILLKDVKPTLVVVEHDRYFLEEVANQIIELKRENIGG